MEHDLDFNRIGVLLMTIGECAKHTPMFTPIAEVAAIELKEMNVAASEWLTERKQAEAEAKAEAAAEEAERVRAEQEEAEKVNAASAGRAAATQPKAIPAKEFETTASTRRA